GKIHHPATLAPQANTSDHNNEDHLQQAEAEMNGVMEREDSPIVLQRIDPLPIESDLLRQIEEAELAQMSDDRAEQQKAEHWQNANGQAGCHHQHMMGGGLTVEFEPCFAAEMLACIICEHLRPP